MATEKQITYIKQLVDQAQQQIARRRQEIEAMVRDEARRQEKLANLDLSAQILQDLNIDNLTNDQASRLIDVLRPGARAMFVYLSASTKTGLGPCYGWMFKSNILPLREVAQAARTAWPL